MKPLVLYHADCTDGFGAAYAAWTFFGDGAEYRPVKYGEMFAPSVCIGRQVFILDFSFISDVMEHILANAERVIWLDHHATSRAYAEEKCGGYIGSRTERHSDNFSIVHDNDKSGALLAWEYFRSGTPAPMFIKMIDDRDRWQFKIPGSKEFHAGLGSAKPWTFEQWDYEIKNIDVHGFVASGKTLLAAQDRHVESMAKQAMACIIDDAKGLAVNATLHISEVGHTLANKSGTYGLIWYLGQDGRVKCSLRSNGDYDVSAIAKKFGGGGHKNAAGFETDLPTIMSWVGLGGTLNG